MRAGLVVPGVLAIAAVLGSGCATGRELRVQSELHAPVVPQHEHRKLEPVAGLMLVNPLVCFSGGGSCSGDSSGLCALLLVGCAGVLGAVDLVALPVQAVRRHGQVRELEEIGLACPLEDPAERAASGLVDRMVREFGFTAATPEGPDAPAAPSRAPVHLRVITTGFERASRIDWRARIDFVGPGGKVLWRQDCAGRAPAREARTFSEECAAAREELDSLADRCVETVAANLRRLWAEWDPARAPAGEPTREAASPVTPPGWDPWTTQ